MINFDSYLPLNDLPGFLHFREGCQLLEWAATWPAEGLCVELGSFLGKSTAFLVEGAKLNEHSRPWPNSSKIYAEVWAIDHWKGSTEHQLDAQHPIQEIIDGVDLFDKFRAIMMGKGYWDYIRPINKTHDEAVSDFSDGGIRLLFIDGEHDYDSTKRNFELWYPKVASGGLIVFHDDDEGHPDVQRCVKELVDSPDSTYSKIDAPKTLAAFRKN